MDDEQIQLNNLRAMEIRITSLRKQLEEMQYSLTDILNTINALNKYGEMKKDSESFTPLGAGILAKSVLRKLDTVYLEIGNVIVEKPINDTIKMLEENQANVQHNIVEMEKAVIGMNKQYTIMLREVQKKLEKKIPGNKDV